ncbi:MAG: NADH:flavin oxidoreductase [Syntrophobacterales bacterium]|jgi:2,4-dienoyl-CoA reductase-like NADH-dependent reductase (Old Yellow Enzyme family)
MSKLFEATVINGMALSNRFIRSATYEGMATDDGAVTPELIEQMVSLVEGGVGLIITGHAFVRRDGQAGPRQLGVYKDELIPDLQAMSNAVHDKGGKIVLQLAHAGIFANAKLSGQIPIGPSAVGGQSGSRPREMTAQDIQEIVETFGAAAKRAKEAGFDGVQIHAAHGYLLSEFLSPIFNQRADEYGGAVENRARALTEALQAVRKGVGSDYPVLVKINCQDFAENGLALEDSVQIGTMLADGGIDAIELSGGLPTSRKFSPVRMGIKSEEKEAYHQNEARAFKERIKVPLILVGGVRSYHLAERLVEEGVADYISMARPFIREPGLINRWRSGDLQKSTCISDNRCFGPAGSGEGVYCVTETKEK